jgi:hypothetical protein
MIVVKQSTESREIRQTLNRCNHQLTTQVADGVADPELYIGAVDGVMVGKRTGTGLGSHAGLLIVPSAIAHSFRNLF